MTRFDTELKDLEAVIKSKKQAIADADLQVQQLEHDIQNLGKEQTTAVNFVAALEKQYEWIAEEYEYVSCSDPGLCCVRSRPPLGISVSQGLSTTLSRRISVA